MLTIRKEQFAVFSQLEVQKFEEWMLAHVRQFFPQQSRAAGESRLREMIQYGIQHAAAYDLTIKRDVCKYIDLMIVFGRDFDTDKRFPWAGGILSQRRNPSVKIRALHESARQHLRLS